MPGISSPVLLDPIPLDPSSATLRPMGVGAPHLDAHGAPATGPLAEVRAGERAVVVEVGLDADLAGWLGAMGLGPGQTLTLIRRAAFGGPLHVRTGSGGELAINAGLARSILVAPLPNRIP
ncbi:FeoA family protein [Sorangium sp. So ce834]|uniref:FeoA family protein n=1 Tax=Sorangium sp. So ce834 TaxID=3133321 RepID=UPI003F5F6BB6